MGIFALIAFALTPALVAAGSIDLSGLGNLAQMAVSSDQIVTKVSEPSTLLLAGVAFLIFAKFAKRSAQPPAEV